MTTTEPSRGILLVDDGELDDVARVLDEQGLAYERLRGGLIPDEVAPPSDLLIVTPRRVERVRRGSPAGAKPGRPLRIIAVDEDSPAMRRRLRRSGLHLLIRLPAGKEIWRLLVARALYKGSERREDPRVAVGSPVWLDGASRIEETDDSTILLDLSNRGCRLQTAKNLAIGDPIEFAIPADSQIDCTPEPLVLRGHVRRLVHNTESNENWVACVFDPKMSEVDRTRLTALINHWASGPRSLDAPMAKGAPPIPPCKLASLPDLTLDDETDPPVASNSEVHVQLGTPGTKNGAGSEPTGAERRDHARSSYASTVTVEADDRPFVLIGRDLSPGGMRIERHPDLQVGDAFKLSLRGPGLAAPFVIEAEIVRDDGNDGLGLQFSKVDRETANELEKMVACLPDVESLEDGEIAGLGAILSEIIPN